MFLLNRGDVRLTKQEYSYGRRAQSTIRSFDWKQVATIDTSDQVEAENEAIAALAEWANLSPSYVRNSRWQLEGIGPDVGKTKELQFV